VVGGLSSLGGAVASGLLFAFLNQLFFDVAALGGYLTVVSAVLLAGTLLLYRGGLAAIPEALRPKLEPVLLRLAPVAGFLNSMLDAVGRAFEWVFVRVRKQEHRSKPTTQRRNPVRGVLERVNIPSFKRGSAVPTKEAPLDLLTLGLGSDAPTAEAPNGTAEAAVSAASAPVTWRTLAAQAPKSLRPERDQGRVVIETTGITVQFGGLTANSDVSLKVCEGEIVGLIGPNGAGKTTFFNAVAGLNQPARGRVMIYGQDVTDLPVHARAEVGVARTFQAIQLFGQLSVFENLLVATHQHNQTTLFGNLLVTPSALSAERDARRQVRRVIELFELESVADRPTRDLPFGVLRMVEVARAVVTRSRIIMLDEPASGLDNNETDKLTEILRFVRSLGVTLLLIEHDVRMVTSVSDYMYVLDGGSLLAEGTPEQIQRNELVIAAYLGQAAEEDKLQV
ncbi:MAG: ATP-binding cassette domain-containing protein, partial [Actinomycetota bacterium]